MGELLWAFTLLGLAALLLAIDLFVPSAGVLSILAIVAVLASIFVAFTAGVREGALLVVLVAILVPVTFAVAARFWPHTPIGRLILIQRPERPEDVLPEWADELEGLVGRLGRAKSKLLPSGAVVIDGRTWDALSTGKPIDAGENVKVVRVRGGRIVVRPATEAELAASSDEPASEQELLSRPIEQLGIDAIDDPLA